MAKLFGKKQAVEVPVEPVKCGHCGSIATTRRQVNQLNLTKLTATCRRCRRLLEIPASWVDNPAIDKIPVANGREFVERPSQMGYYPVIPDAQGGSWRAGVRKDKRK